MSTKHDDNDQSPLWLLPCIVSFAHMLKYTPTIHPPSRPAFISNKSISHGASAPTLYPTRCPTFSGLHFSSHYSTPSHIPTSLLQHILVESNKYAAAEAANRVRRLGSGIRRYISVYLCRYLYQFSFSSFVSCARYMICPYVYTYDPLTLTYILKHTQSPFNHLNVPSSPFFVAFIYLLSSSCVLHTHKPSLSY